jgi:uncharacterized membrane protein YccC
MLDWLIARTPVNSRSSGVKTGLLKILRRESRDDSYPNAWTRLRIQLRDLRPQLRLCLRVTVAALVSFVLGKSLSIPFGGLWAALTAVVVTQVSVGGSLKATIEYLTGTLGGAVYAGAIVALVPHANEVSLLVALAIAVRRSPCSLQ